MIYFRNLFICAFFLPLQYVFVPVMLLTKWDGYTTPFGNNKHGRGNKHYAHATKGFWQEFVWLTYRNPINNVMNWCGVTCQYPINISGNPAIGDKTMGGWCFVRMGKCWEFYCVIPYLKRHCVRIRLGWKIIGKQVGELCPMVFAIRPIQNYSGV